MYSCFKSFSCCLQQYPSLSIALFDDVPIPHLFLLFHLDGVWRFSRYACFKRWGKGMCIFNTIRGLPNFNFFFFFFFSCFNIILGMLLFIYPLPYHCIDRLCPLHWLVLDRPHQPPWAVYLKSERKCVWEGVGGDSPRSQGLWGFVFIQLSSFAARFRVMEAPSIRRPTSLRWTLDMAFQ